MRFSFYRGEITSATDNRDQLVILYGAKVARSVIRKEQELPNRRSKRSFEARIAALDGLPSPVRMLQRFCHYILESSIARLLAR
jgi:hypothetical protein